jgi:hypothetical protein
VARSTRIIRPSRLEPFRLLIAFSASWSFAISTNPNPRDRPVSRSVMTAADWTMPKRAKASRSPSVAVENAKPPTNSLTDMRTLLSSHCLDGTQYNETLQHLRGGVTIIARAGGLSRGAAARGR